MRKLARKFIAPVFAVTMLFTGVGVTTVAVDVANPAVAEAASCVTSTTRINTFMRNVLGSGVGYTPELRDRLVAAGMYSCRQLAAGVSRWTVVTRVDANTTWRLTYSEAERVVRYSGAFWV